MTHPPSGTLDSVVCSQADAEFQGRIISRDQLIMWRTHGRQLNPRILISPPMYKLAAYVAIPLFPNQDNLRVDAGTNGSGVGQVAAGLSMA